MALNDVAFEPHDAIQTDARRGAVVEFRHRAGYGPGFHPHQRLVADIDQHTARFDQFADDEVVLQHGAGLRRQQVEDAGGRARVVGLSQRQGLRLGHAVGHHPAEGLLPGDLRFGVAPPGHRVPAERLHAPPLSVGDDEFALRFRHLDAREGQQPLSGIDVVAQTHMPCDHLGRDAGRDPRRAVRVADDLAGQAHGFAQRAPRNGLDRDARGCTLVESHFDGAAPFFLAVSVMVVLLGVGRGADCETGTQRPESQCVHEAILPCRAAEVAIHRTPPWPNQASTCPDAHNHSNQARHRAWRRSSALSRTSSVAVN